MSNVIWVDENDNELGIVPCEKAHREGLMDRIVVVYVTRSNGDILVQERMDGRLDHSSAGHVDPGEEYLTAAKRELREELGIDTNLTEVGKGRSGEIGLKKEGLNVQHMFMVYMCEAEPHALAEREVKGVYWENPHEVMKKMEQDPDEIRYCGAFKASLALYLGWLKKKS